MRRAIREKVVPEEVVPQNVINQLIDEDAEPPKTDAFAFLMRLRALGIGSADFLNLLEGCGAPESVILKIKRNPAMNLQGLILTLENSELTSDDYKRMLLTARQVWERTLTLRLEKTEKISREMERESAQNEEQDEIPAKSEIEEDSENADFSEDEPEDEDGLDIDEEMSEMSFTAVLDRISEELRNGTLAPNEDEREVDEQDEQEVDGQDEQEVDEQDEQEVAGQDEQEVDEQDEQEISGQDEDVAEVREEQNDNSDGGELSFTDAFDRIKSGKQVSPADAGDDIGQSAIIDIDGDALKERIGGRDGESRIFDEVYKDVDEEEPDADGAERDFDNDGEFHGDEEFDGEEPDYDDDNDDDDDDDDGDSRVYHKGAIIGGAVGAAALIGAGIFMGGFTLGKAKKLDYAEDNTEIFAKIYEEYTAGQAGGEEVYGIGSSAGGVFGDLLIGSADGDRIGYFSQDDSRLLITRESISVSVVKNGEVTALEDVLPPENARFVAAFDENGELYAVFSGEVSGYTKLKDGKAQYTVCQDGVLTDFESKDGEIRLGTVYTPNFTHNFTVNDEDVYLPKIGIEKAPITAANVVISDTDGYSYGVSAGYSAENGQTLSACAVIGDPAAVSADGRFAMNGDVGLLLTVQDGGDGGDGEGDEKGEILSQSTEVFSRAAFFENGCALVGAENSKGNSDVKILDKDMKPASNITGISAKISGMWFDGSVLTVDGEDGVILRADCSDTSAPKTLVLQNAEGVCIGNSALTFGVSGNAFTITRYERENGEVRELAKFTKELPAEQLSTVKFGDLGAVLMSGAKSGAAFSYFDGVSVVSEYAVFENGVTPQTVSVYDDKTGFTAAFEQNGKITAVCGEGAKSF